MTIGQGVIIVMLLIMMWKDLRELRKATAERKQAERELEEDKVRLTEARADMDRVMEELRVEVGKNEMDRCGRKA